MCFIFPPHLTSASTLPGETENPEIASFHLNAACFFTKKHETQFQLEMWANAQRDGRPAEYRWRRLFNAVVWLCSNAAKTRNPLKLAGCPKLTKQSQPLVGRSSPYCKDMCERYCCLTIFFRLSIRASVAKI